MTRNRQKIRRLTLASFFVALEVLMAFTPIGYIPVGALSITTMHLPVILAGVLGGPLFGAGMGFVFGLTSFLRATFQPSLTSFVFSPFITVGGISGNFSSLLICFVPRILLGAAAAVIFRSMHRLCRSDAAAAAVGAGAATVIHTVLVLGGIYVFFAQDYAAALSTDLSGVAVLFLGTVSTNMILETILACAAVPVLYRALAPAAGRMKLIRN